MKRIRKLKNEGIYSWYFGTVKSRSMPFTRVLIQYRHTKRSVVKVGAWRWNVAKREDAGSKVRPVAPDERIYMPFSAMPMVIAKREPSPPFE